MFLYTYTYRNTQNILKNKIIEVTIYNPQYSHRNFNIHMKLELLININFSLDFTGEN